jgi:hypothetical protein
MILRKERFRSLHVAKIAKTNLPNANLKQPARCVESFLTPVLIEGEPFWQGL